MEYYSKAAALLSLLPDAEFVWDGEDRKYEDLRMIKGEKPTEDAIYAEYIRLNE